MTSPVNPSISVDCVVFGFDGSNLNVLLIDFTRSGLQPTPVYHGTEHKLPGTLILENEDLDTAAHRALTELTGLEQVFLRQFAVFSDPVRISNPVDLEWIEKVYGVKATRIVTVAYFALVKINSSNLRPHIEGKVDWYKVDEIRHLAFDHKSILLKALETLHRLLLSEPIAFELLQKRFSIRQLQNLYEAILGIEIDNRNFRKKVLKLPFLKPIGEKEKHVAHKPALLYKFDRAAYEREIKRNKIQMDFIRIF